jgi:hypothetical protein
MNCDSKITLRNVKRIIANLPDFGIQGVRQQDLPGMLGSDEISYWGDYYFAGEEDRQAGMQNPRAFFRAFKNSIWNAVMPSMKNNLTYVEDGVVFGANPTVLLYTPGTVNVLGDKFAPSSHSRSWFEGSSCIFRCGADALREYTHMVPLEFSRAEQDNFNQECISRFGKHCKMNTPYVSDLLESELSDVLAGKAIHKLRKMLAGSAR